MNASGAKSEHICQKKPVIWSGHLLMHYLSDVPLHLRACSYAVVGFFADGKVQMKSLKTAFAFPNKHIQPKPS